jgi:hypothetical protein
MVSYLILELGPGGAYHEPRFLQELEVVAGRDGDADGEVERRGVD